MVVRGHKLESRAGQVVLTARLEPEGSERPCALRLGVDRAYADWLDRSGNPFVPVATVLATAIGEDLTFEDPVSPVLARGAEAASAKFADWWGYRATAIEAPPADPREPGDGVAALFSGGLDTSATVVRSLRGEIQERATHLLSMYGAEFKLSPRTKERRWREVSVAASEHGLPLIRVTSNAPAVFDGRISWPRGYGANFGSLALVLGPRFETVLFGASQLPEEPRAHGSRHDLDPLWSSEATAIKVDGAQLGKLGRAAVVGSSKTALEHLMVCWKSDQPGNCGCCEKCLRTMTCLQVAGALERTDRFDRPLNFDAISRCTPNRHGAPLIRELVERLPAEESELRAAWAAKLREVEAGLRAERRRKAVARLSRRARRAPHRTRRALRRARRAPRRLARLTPRRLRRRFTG